MNPLCKYFFELENLFETHYCFLFWLVAHGR